MNSATVESEPLPALGRNLTFGVFDRLGRAIVAGHYDQAPFPTEMDLVRQYRVSHGVVREAVKMLAAKGLINAQARRGTMAEPEQAWNLLDVDILRWLLERGVSRDLAVRFNDLRVAIEPEAAALAARAASAEDHLRIETGLKRIAAARRGGENPAEADMGFHLAILRATRNPFYAQFQALLTTALRASFRLPGRTRGVSDYASVFEAIRIRDPDRARDRMRDIINDAPTDSRPL